jgi:hypothetical protein
MSHICANDEYMSQIGKYKPIEKHRHSLPLSRLYASKVVDVFSFHLQIFHSAFAQKFPRSQPMRESNTSTVLSCDYDGSRL